MDQQSQDSAVFLLPPESRKLEVVVCKDGTLLLNTYLYSRGGWALRITVGFSEFSEKVATIDDLLAFIGKEGVDWDAAD